MTSYVTIAIFLLLGHFQLPGSCFHSNGIGCLNNDGNLVDWFVVYKLPKVERSSNPLIRKGLAQVYFDPKTKDWTLLDKGIDETDHAIAKTLQQIYSNSTDAKNVAYLLYNDAVWGEENYTREVGHTKGSIAFDHSSGFWLVHSVPKFPPPLKDVSYKYPKSGMVYGQSFLCITLEHQHFNEIGHQLQYNYPQIYDHRLPPSLEKENPALFDVIAEQHVTKAPWSRIYPMKTLGGKRFLSFAKFSKYGKDLYQDFLAPYFNADLLVETWRKPPGQPLPSHCSGAGPKVLNIDKLKILGNEFNNADDHSKWAVTSDARNSSRWICVGDINRVEGQKHRAGGTVCGRLPVVPEAFRSAIQGIESCKPTSVHTMRLA